MVRYLIVLPNETVHCIGMLPRIGEQISVRRQYGKKEVLLCRVINVRYSVDVYDEPFDDKGARGEESCDDISKVYVGIESRE